MTLAFRTHWPKTMPPHMAGKPTYFVEKIIKQMEVDSFFAEFLESKEGYALDFPTIREGVTKKHTIREDVKGLWKAGRDIHFVINNRTKNRLQFAPVLKCVSVQKIKIYKKDVPAWSVFKGCKTLNIKVDGRRLTPDEMDQLAHNDGFDSIEDFFSWFNKDFKGKIIHWTDINY